MLEAQPYLVKVWDLSWLMDAEDSFLTRYLRHLVWPNNQVIAQSLSAAKTIEALEYLESLRFDKLDEAKKHASIDKLFGAYPSLPRSAFKDRVYKGKVMTSYLHAKVCQVETEMERGIFQHFVVSGEEGSGKMSFMELLSSTFHERRGLVVVTLEETFDSKNLVGTYVCNESGEFVFKKGPLTVAAEEGMWLVLRHIEKAPSDLLSFLLPLVQQNVLQVTANFKIVPKLGFRIFALCHKG